MGAHAPIDRAPTVAVEAQDLEARRIAMASQPEVDLPTTNPSDAAVLSTVPIDVIDGEEGRFCFAAADAASSVRVQRLSLPPAAVGNAQGSTAHLAHREVPALATAPTARGTGVPVLGNQQLDLPAFGTAPGLARSLLRASLHGTGVSTIPIRDTLVNLSLVPNEGNPTCVAGKLERHRDVPQSDRGVLAPVPLERSGAAAILGGSYAS